METRETHFVEMTKNVANYVNGNVVLKKRMWNVCIDLNFEVDKTLFERLSLFKESCGKQAFEIETFDNENMGRFDAEIAFENDEYRFCGTITPKGSLISMCVQRIDNSSEHFGLFGSLEKGGPLLYYADKKPRKVGKWRLKA